MAIDFACDGCGKRFSLRDELAGKKARCTACGAIMRVPMSPAVAPAAPVAVWSPPAIPAARPAPFQPASNVQVVVNQAAEGKSANGLGVAGVVIGVVGLAGCWIPLLNLLVLPLAAIGGLLALVGLVVAMTNRRSGPGGAIAGVATNGVAVAGVIAMNAMFAGAIGNAAREAREERDRATREFVVAGPQAPGDVKPIPNRVAAGPIHAIAPPPEEQPRPILMGQLGRIDDLEVGVLKVVRGKVPLVDRFPLPRDDGRGESKDELLSVYIGIRNASESRKIDYRTVAGGDFIAESAASLKDNLGNAYKRIGFGFSTEVEGRVKSESIYPGKEITDHLVFELPVENASNLVLEIPAKQAGAEKGVFRFLIPMDQIGNRPNAMLPVAEPAPVPAPVVSASPPTDPAQEAAERAERAAAILMTGKNFEKVGKDKDALGCYRRVVANFKDTPSAKEAEARIKVLARR